MKSYELIILHVTKYALAIVIVIMGGYGYYQFFNNGGVSFSVVMIISLFVVIETSMLAMTTIRFQDTLTQEKHLSIGLFFAIVMMWIISTVGIDQTIWHSVESKYHTVQKEQAAVDAENQTEKALIKKVAEYQTILAAYQKEKVSEDKVSKFAKRDFDKKSRQLTETIWFDGNDCSSSADCSARRENAIGTLNISKQLLDSHLQNTQILQDKIIDVEHKIDQVREKIDTIVINRENFFKAYNTQKENAVEEGLIHTRIMDFFNLLLDDEIKTPQRAYVMLLSLVVYPIYILFVMFVSAQSPQKRAMRQKAQELKERLQLDNIKNKRMFYDALMIVANLLKKILFYIIATRKRKVIEKTIEVEVEKEIEIIKEIYKDGKEILKVEVEVPYIIEKEVIVERVIEKPIIEKEFVVIPADIDLNRLNEITGNGSTPKDLSSILKEISDNPSKFTFEKGVDHDKHRAA